MEAQRFGVRLRELRRQAGMTQRELADRVNIDFSYLSKIESGVMPPPSEKVILQLADALGAEKDELLTLAGRIPPDIAQILRDQEILRSLRSGRIQKMVSSSKKRGETIHKMKQLMSYKSLSKIAIPIVLVLAVTASLWFASPVKAVSVSLTASPSSVVQRGSITFTGTITISSQELIPIQSVELHILDAAGTTELTSSPYSSPRSMSLVSTAPSGYGYYGYGYRYGYDESAGYGYWFIPEHGYGYGPYGYGTYGYGYGYGYVASYNTVLTYRVVVSTSTAWATGSYYARMDIDCGTHTYSSSATSFTVTAYVPPYVPPEEEEEEEVEAVVPAPPPAGTTDVSDYVNEDGVFTEDVTAESEDALCELFIEEDTTGLTEDGEPLSEISIIEMEEPPAPPEDSSVIGLVYDFGPDGATFEPPITLTFTYDPDDIPEGVNEEDLVIAMWVWDEAAEEWVWDELSPCTVDPVTHTITAPVSGFTAFTVLAYTRPAAFATSALSVSPAEVGIGETVTISSLVTNTGDLTGSYEVTLKIDNIVVATEEVTLAGSASEEVTFTTSRDVAGSYAVDVNGLTGTFVVKPAPAPAAFTTTELSISPAEVDIGETVTISSLVTNTGDLTGSYKVTLKIDNIVVATKEVTLTGGASQEVTFTTSKDVAGSYAVDVNGLTGTFVVKAVPAPAAFTTTELSVSPAEVDIGETVTISALVTNTGDLSGSYKVTLKIDNVVVVTKEVTLAGGASQEVTFATSRDIAGSYAVDVNGLTGTFKVRAVPAPAPAVFTASALSVSPAEVKAGETVNISAIVTNTGEAKGSHTVTLKINGVTEATKGVTLAGGQSTTVAFAVTRDLAGSYEVEVDGLIGSFTVTKLINWWLIGGIIAACIIIGVVIWLAVRRRRA